MSRGTHLAFVLLLPAAHAAVRFNYNAQTLPLADRMVLQRAPQRARVWGTSDDANGTVAVTVTASNGTELASTEVRVNSTDSTWTAELPPIEAASGATVSASDLANASAPAAILSDVAIGEVLLCSGQSNMQFKIEGSSEFLLIGNRTSYWELPDVRMLDAVTSRLSSIVATDAPLAAPAPPVDLLGDDMPSGWWKANSTLTFTFSAICYDVGRAVHESYGVPVGLVASAVGGTPIEAWTRQSAVETCPDAVAIGQNKSAGSLFKSYVEPLAPMTFRAVVWDQGENNFCAGPAANPDLTGPVLWKAYSCMFPAMITDWRAVFETPELPFVYVELCMAPNADWWATGHMAFWLAQRAAMALDRVGFATTTDLQQLVHPPNKTAVGARLVRELRRVAFGAGAASAPARGPEVLAASRVDNDTIRVTLSNASSSLFVAEGFLACDSGSAEAMVPGSAEAKQCASVPAKQLVDPPSCRGGPTRESPFICDEGELGASDYFNASRTAATWAFDDDGTVLVRGCGARGVTLNQVARYDAGNGTVGPCTLYGSTGLPAVPENITKLLD